MKYRAEIDGLRALAVVPVIFFHAGFSLFSGGFIGVDVFFVISGYLITTILIEDLENNRFSIVHFYERRARRLLPALFVVMMFCVLFAWILLSDVALSKFGNGLIGVSLFLSNVIFWRQQGYFEDSAELNPILHTWSLAVEEQYYLFFPLFLLIAWRLHKNKVIWVIIFLTAVSLLLSEWGWRNRPVANFYLAPTRAWELFSGSIAAFIVQKNDVQKNNFLSLLGLSAIIFSIFFYHETTPVPSIYVLVPVLGSVLIILFASKETIVSKLLSTKIFVGFGLISYSAYLWHQPLFAFFRIYTNEITLNWISTLVLIIITLLLSFLSWKFVETPFRNRNFINRSVLFYCSLVVLISLFAIGFFSRQSIIGAEYRLAKQLSENDFVYFENLDERKFMEGRLTYPLEPVNSVVVGSSRVMQINSSVMGENIQNFAVSGASLEDSIAFGLEALAKLKYQTVYVSADPWLINLNDKNNRYQSISKLLDYWMNRMYSNQPLVQYLNTELRSPTNNSLGSILNYLRSFLWIRDAHIPTNKSVEAYAKRAYDGSHIYSAKYVNNKYDLDFTRLLNYENAGFNYDSQSIQNFETFVAYMQKNEVTVNLIFSPYHPHLYKMMKAQNHIFLEIEEWYRNFADRKGIRIIGSYDGEIMGCTEDEFYDEMHPMSSCMKKLFNGSDE